MKINNGILSRIHHIKLLLLLLLGILLLLNCLSLQVSDISKKIVIIARDAKLYHILRLLF